MTNIIQTINKFIADLEVRALDENVPWVRGYYKGQLEAYKVTLMMLENAENRQNSSKVFTAKSDKYTNGGK